MPSPHYLTERNGQIITINKEKRDANWKDGSGVSCLKLIAHDHIPVVDAQGGRGGGSSCTPIFNNKAMYRTFSGPRNIAFNKNDQQASNHREVSSQASLFMQSGQKMIVSASTQPRSRAHSPIMRRASRGKDTSSSTGTLVFHDHDMTTSKSTSSIHVTDNNDNIPKHDLFPSHADLKNNDTTHDIKNARRDSDSLCENEDIECASTNNSTTSDETNSVSSSVASGDSQLCNSNDGNSGNSKNKCADRGQEGGCFETSSSTAAAAALVGLQQKSVDRHESTDIVKPRDTDVISGRGNGANRRPGNIRFREIVTKYKGIYLYAKAADKKTIARNVVREVEAMNPPARFLHQDEKTGMWTVLDRRKILRKVAQALREPPSMRKFRGSSKVSVSSPQVIQPTPEIIPDVSSGQSKNEEQREQAAKWTPRRISLRAPSDTIENGTRQKRLLTRASVNESDIISDNSKKHRPESGSCVLDRYGEGTSDKALMSLQEVPMSIQNSSHNKMMNTAAQSLTGLSYGVTTPKNLNLSDSDVHMVHGLHTRGSVIQYLGNHVNHQIPSQFLGRCDISLPYFLNYRNMGIVSSSPSSLMTLPTEKKHTDTVDNNHAETLRNISIVASSCSDLTALYLIVRTGSESFTRNSFLVSTQTIEPTQYDVLINACDIHNHPGNLNLAESVQLSYADYINAELSGNLKSNVINNVISSVTKENEKALSAHPQDKHRGRFLLRYTSQKKTNSSPSEAWFVLPKKNVVAIIESLLQQACAFILNPDPGDVLFGRKDLSRLSPGNMYFKSIINSCKAVYMQSSTEDKLNYAVEIVGIVTSRPGRFLGNIEEMGMWMPLSFDSAIEKTQKHLSGEIKD